MTLVHLKTILNRLAIECDHLHLERIGVERARLVKQQADYLGVPVEGSSKLEHYRY